VAQKGKAQELHAACDTPSDMSPTIVRQWPKSQEPEAVESRYLLLLGGPGSARKIFPRKDRWTADLSTALRFGRDDKGKGGASKAE
jgi:hypothetical protein